MPKLEPYVELCKEDSKINAEVIHETGEIDAIVDNVRIARTLEKLKALLQNAERIHMAVSPRYHDIQYEKRLEESAVLKMPTRTTALSYFS